MFDIFSGLLGLGSSLFGANKAAKGADADRELQYRAMQGMSNASFSPRTVIGPGNAGVAFGSGGTPIFQLGQFDPINRQFQQFAPSNFQSGGNLMGLANRSLMQQFGNMDAANSLAGSAGANARSLMNQGGPNTGIPQAGNQLMGLGSAAIGGANPFSQAARNFTGRADQGFDSLRDQTLGTLRAQAQPFEERAFSDLQDNLFATGRLGSTGGALQTEAFARGLGQTDLNRQLQATNVAQQQQMQSGNLANIFGSLANQSRNVGGNLFSQGADIGLRGQALEDDLLSNAFKRFGATSGLANDLNSTFFNRGDQTQLAGLRAVSGMQGITDSLMGMGRFGANLGAQKASTDIQRFGGAGNIANQMGPSGSDIWGGFASSLGANLFQGSGGFQNLFEGLGGLFGNKTTPERQGMF